MSTLIAQYNSEGCVGRCDANCYDATKPNCTCICGGKNHGVGLRRAASNAREMAAELVEHINGKEAAEKFRIEFPEVQLPLL